MTLGVPDTERFMLADNAAAPQWDWADTASAMFRTIGRQGPAHAYPYPAQISRYLRQVPQARLFVGTGMYDSLTSTGMVDHLLAQYPIPRERVTSKWYPSGHMMYSDPASSRRLVDDIVAFVTASEDDDR